MLNRHAIVLFVGMAALFLLRSIPADVTPLIQVPQLPYGLLGTSFLLVVVGLFLDSGIPGPRAQAGHLMQCVGGLLLLVDALANLGSFASLHVVLGELGLAFCVLGVWLEMVSRLSALRFAVTVHALGDLFFLAGLAVALIARNQSPSVLGWVFIALTGLLGMYAAISNFVLQLARLRNPQAGWRYKILRADPGGLFLKTPQGEQNIDWSLVEALKPLDDRHLILVLPTALPPELAQADLPVDELRSNAEPTAADHVRPPERYGLVFHEQELGRPVQEATQQWQQHLRPEMR